MAVIGQALAPAQGAVNAPNAPEGNLHGHHVTLLHKHYIDKHKEMIGPWKTFIDGAALILALSIALFSQIGGLAAGLLGGGIVCIVSGIGRALLNRNESLFINQKAAEVLITPGFVEFAAQHRLNLSSPQQIFEGFARFR